MSTTKRAYTEEAKQERERKIIAAAEALLMEKGYYAINMDQIAQAAGLAKGTVYLYFKTKEELFLTVFEHQAAAWFNEIEQALSGTADASPKASLVDLLVKTLAYKPMLTRLVALTPLIFEYNVPLERVRAHKLWVLGSLSAIGQAIEAKFNLRSGQGLPFLFKTFIIVAGLEGFAHPSPITDQVYVQEPTLIRFDFEAELTRLLLMLLNTSGDESA